MRGVAVEAAGGPLDGRARRRDAAGKNFLPSLFTNPVVFPILPQEVQELCEEWQPEPLAGPIMAARADATPPVVSSDVGPYIVADGRRVLNLASTNFLGIAGDPEIRVRHSWCTDLQQSSLASAPM